MTRTKYDTLSIPVNVSLRTESKLTESSMYAVKYNILEEGKKPRPAIAYIVAHGESDLRQALHDTRCPDNSVKREYVGFKKLNKGKRFVILSRDTIDDVILPLVEHS